MCHNHNEGKQISINSLVHQKPTITGDVESQQAGVDDRDVRRRLSRMGRHTKDLINNDIFMNYNYSKATIETSTVIPYLNRYTFLPFFFPSYSHRRPTFDCHNDNSPTEYETCECDGKIQESHHVVPASTHGGPTNLFIREHENNTTGSPAEGRENFCRWPRGQSRVDRRRGIEEYVGETPEKGATSKKDTPQRVNLHLENICLMMSGHGKTSLKDVSVWLKHIVL